MAVDKLVDSSQLDNDLTSIADAIRNKSGDSGNLVFPTGFVSGIEGLDLKAGEYKEIYLSSTTQLLEFDNLDFEPKGVVYINTNTMDNIYAHLPPRPAISGKVSRGIKNAWLFDIRYLETMTQYNVSGFTRIDSDQNITSSTGGLFTNKTQDAQTGKWKVTVQAPTQNQNPSYFVGWDGAPLPHQFLILH